IHLQAILYIDFRKKTATKACPEISQGLSSFPVQHEEISWRKKFGSYLFGMSDVVAKQSAEANTPLNIKNLHLGSKLEHWGSFSHSVSCGMPLGRTVVGLYKQFKNIDAFPVNDRSTPTTVTPTTVTISYDNKRRTELFLKDRIQSWIAVTGYVIMAIVSIVTVPHIFPQLKWYHILTMYIIAPVLAFCNAYGCGLTDWSLASTYGNAHCV
ncbi:unnamed protein product, partial [Brassica oleracea var. botrytis]